jgi:hypothetical protein
MVFMLVASLLWSVLQLTSPATAPEAPAPRIAGAAQAAQRSSMFGEPVIVDGKQIPDDEIRRLICFGLGGTQVDMLKFNVFVDDQLARYREAELERLTAEEVARRTAAGEPAEIPAATLEALAKQAADHVTAKYAIADDFAARRLQADREDFALKYPTLDFATEVSRAFLSLDLYKEHARARLLFDSVYLPENPDEWPEITMSLIVEGLSESWVNDSRISYNVRKERQAKEGLPDIPPDDPIATDTQRQTILEALEGYARISIDRDEIEQLLPEAGPDSPAEPAARAEARRERARSVLMLVEGVPITIDAVWDRIAPYVTPDLVEDAKRFLVHEALMEKELASRTWVDKSGDTPVERPALMSPTEFRAWWPTTSRREGPVSYHQHLVDQRMSAQQVLAFPSLYAFARFQRIFESFKRAIAEDLAKDEVIATIQPMATQVAGASRVSTEIILVSAYDFVNVRWKPNGWEEARQRALELDRQLDGGADWTAMLELHSEFWDPPLPEVGHKPQFGFRFKGKFGQQTRGMLLSFLEEGEYRTFLYGQQIGDHVFFDQKIGTIDGPFRGAKGYYITRVTGRTPPSKPLDIKLPAHRQIIEYYYTRDRFHGRVRELFDAGVAAGTIQGVKPGGGIRDV